MKQFREPGNTAVFTTRFVLEGSPIVLVTHDEDGAWQFHSEEDIINDDDIKLVSLDEMIRLDNSILELADMPESFRAMRGSKTLPWKIVGDN